MFGGWLITHWVTLVFSLTILCAAAVLGLWSRLLIYERVRKRMASEPPLQLLIRAAWNHYVIWFILLGVFVAILISVSSPGVRIALDRVLGTIFVISLAWIAIGLSGQFIKYYLDKAPGSFVTTALLFSRAVVALIVFLFLLDIWGVLTPSVTVIVLTSLLIGSFTLRNTVSNLSAGFEIAYGELVKVGDTIKLETGDTGVVTRFSWTQTTLTTSQGHRIIIPNSRLAATTLLNYGDVTTIPSTNPVQQSPATIEPVKLDTLTGREREVICLISEGATNREIAERLFLSEHTVKSHLRSLLNKLNVRNRQQLAVYAHREGIVMDIKETKTNPPAT